MDFLTKHGTHNNFILKIVVLCLFVLFPVIGFVTGLQFNNTPQLVDYKIEEPKINTLKYDLSDYIKIEKNTLNEDKNGLLSYRFDKGDTTHKNKKNFIINFPQVWDLYISNNKNSKFVKSGINGSTLLLKRGNNYIVINQLLWEGDLMTYNPETANEFKYIYIVNNLKENHRDWKVYKIPEETDLIYDDKNNNYGICQKVQGDTCSSWTEIGAINYSSEQRDKKILREFIEIIQNIEVLK